MLVRWDKNLEPSFITLIYSKNPHTSAKLHFSAKPVSNVYFCTVQTELTFVGVRLRFQCRK